jgi:hypothetical protein
MKALWQKVSLTSKEVRKEFHGRCTIEISVPLSHFLDYLKSVKEKGRTFPHLNEVEWLLRNFRCDDQVAQYEPEPLPESDTLWWQIYARN